MSAHDEYPFVTVLIPVKNAERFIGKCLESLNDLNYPKDRYEVIISDSDSTDRTRIIAASLGARVIVADGPSVCAARNSGFKVARGQIIAISDADCVMDKDWLSNAVKYFKDDTVACVGGVSLTPDDETPFGKACGFIFSFPLFTGGSTYGMNFDKVREVRHNAGCNALYRRSALDRVIPIDECFFEGEDVIMNKKLKDLGYRFLYTPDTKLWHYRSSTPRRFFRQNVRYGIGRVLMGRRYKDLLNPMHMVIGFSIPLMIVISALALFFDARIFLAITGLGMIFLASFVVLALVKTGSLRVAIRVPLAVVLLLFGWSLGFMKESLFPSYARNG